MAEITASLVKELREKTGAGMMECKKALTETNGDLEAAIDWLRKKGLSVAAKKAGRIASQGLVGLAVDGNKGVVVEVNSETDFVARNEEFQNFVNATVDAALAGADNIDALKAAPMNGKTVADTLTDLIAKIGENMNLRRVDGVAVAQGVVVPYVHTAVTSNLGKIGVLVALESSADANQLQDLAKKIAMHVAAAAPRFLTISDVDETSLMREKAIFEEQARASGKPANIIEKMVEGRLRKFYEEVVLMEQAFIMDPDKKIKDILSEAEKSLGAPITLKGFVRYALGEGLEKKNEDFAEEVKKQIG